MNVLLAGELIAQRVFNPLYIYLDTAFLVALCVLLVLKKKYCTLVFGLCGGVLYMLVDYGIFHLALRTRSIEGGDMFWVLLWMSMSYGLTNFVWIWLWFSKDRHAFLFTALILIWWICAPMIAESFGADLGRIKIQRTTGAYHGYMALIMFAGYLAGIIYNLFQADKSTRMPLLWLFVTCVAVQLGWEFSLLLGNIRSAEIAGAWEKLRTLAVNSLLETNLGAVPLFAIYTLVSARITEDMKKRENTGFKQRIAQINNIKFKDMYN